MSSKIKNLWEKFSKRAFREAFVASRITTQIAAQIQTLREDRGWTQAQLAEASGMAQSRISMLEDPTYDRMTLQTLRRVAAAFDVAVSVRMVPYSEILHAGVLSGERGFSVPSFLDDRLPQAAAPGWNASATILSNPKQKQSVFLAFSSQKHVLKTHIETSKGTPNAA